MRRLAPRLLVVWILAATILSLVPFHPDWHCAICPNGAEIAGPGGGLTFGRPGLARAEVPAGFVDALRDSGVLGVEMQVTPATAEQSGPARILSFSADPFRRNFTLGQEFGALVVRLRMDGGDANGEAREIVVPGVFAAGREVAIRVEHDRTGTSVFVDGSRRARAETGPVDFASWDPGFDLLIGNEATADRAWLGSVARIAVASAPDRPVLAAFDFAGEAPPPPALLDRGDLRYPVAFLGPDVFRNERVRFSDLVLHVGMLLPVGFLLTLILQGRGRGRAGTAATAMLAVVAFAMAIEIAQHFNADRTMSLFDLLWGVLGGAIGTAWALSAAARTPSGP